MKYCVSCGGKAGITSPRTKEGYRVCKDCYEKCSAQTKHHWKELDSQEIAEDIARWQERNINVSPEAMQKPKEYCANCGGKLGLFGGNEISEGFALCIDCVKQCSLLVKEKLSEKTINEVKRDIMQMKSYPEYRATDRFGKISFDKVHKLWRAEGYPVMRYEDIIDFEIVDVREKKSDSTTKEDKKGRDVTYTSYSEHFLRLGIQFVIQGTEKVSFLANYAEHYENVKYHSQLLEQVHDAAGFLKIVLHENETKNKAKDISHAMQISAAEAILKFKELFDYGLITEEEFEAKKQQILNL
ncbi:MAG: SHOCT domain-containing protein [Lachnospiraceae bacterium]|nr:SHOCT domain-containing protein [Lachnospiraceae bacterium]